MRAAARPYGMSKFYSFLGATIGSYAGWIIGARVGQATAFIVSMIGTGLGIYYGRRIAQYYGG
jgi:phage tail tape-measure protein